MRPPWGLEPPAGPWKTTRLIGRVWKRREAWSLPVLIAREAWPYNAQAASEGGGPAAPQRERHKGVRLPVREAPGEGGGGGCPPRAAGRRPAPEGAGDFCLAAMAGGNHPIPSRPRK